MAHDGCGCGDKSHERQHAALKPETGPLLAAIAADLELLAILHDREPTAALIAALKACSIAEQLSLRLGTADARNALAAFDAAVAELPSVTTPEILDELAAAYADVYLRHTYRAAPTESVWLTEDGLERQWPTLDIREDIARNNLRSTDWAGRSEDHLVPQLLYIAHRLKNASSDRDVENAVHFLDAHLMRWIRKFAARLVAAGAPDFFAALAVLTGALLDEARDTLAVVTGVARPKEPEPEKRKITPLPSVEDRPYMPGVAPSW